MGCAPGKRKKGSTLRPREGADVRRQDPPKFCIRPKNSLGSRFSYPLPDSPPTSAIVWFWASMATSFRPRRIPSRSGTYGLPALQRWNSLWEVRLGRSLGSGRHAVERGGPGQSPIDNGLKASSDTGPIDRRRDGVIRAVARHGNEMSRGKSTSCRLLSSQPGHRGCAVGEHRGTGSLNPSPSSGEMLWGQAARRWHHQSPQASN
jgi:hypothetical protein